MEYSLPDEPDPSVTMETNSQSVDPPTAMDTSNTPAILPAANSSPPKIAPSNMDSNVDPNIARSAYAAFYDDPTRPLTHGSITIARSVTHITDIQSCTIVIHGLVNSDSVEEDTEEKALLNIFNMLTTTGICNEDGSSPLILFYNRHKNRPFHSAHVEFTTPTPVWQLFLYLAPGDAAGFVNPTTKKYYRFQLKLDASSSRTQVTAHIQLTAGSPLHIHTSANRDRNSFTRGLHAACYELNVDTQLEILEAHPEGLPFPLSAPFLTIWHPSTSPPDLLTYIPSRMQNETSRSSPTTIALFLPRQDSTDANHSHTARALFRKLPDPFTEKSKVVSRGATSYFARGIFFNLYLVDVATMSNVVKACAQSGLITTPAGVPLYVSPAGRSSPLLIQNEHLDLATPNIGVLAAAAHKASTTIEALLKDNPTLDELAKAKATAQQLYKARQNNIPPPPPRTSNLPRTTAPVSRRLRGAQKLAYLDNLLSTYPASSVQGFLVCTNEPYAHFSCIKKHRGPLLEASSSPSTNTPSTPSPLLIT
eukprot:gene29155-32377_t